MQVAGMTNRGLERSRNEDSCFVRADTDMALLVVADGMGGHQAGDVASSMAVSAAEKLWNDLNRSAPLSMKKARTVVEKLVREANRQIMEEAGSSTARQGMGTTLTTGLLYGKELTIGHIGDSRAYKISKGKIELLTRDHSLVEHLVESGQIKPEEARHHPQRHVLTRALGISPDPEVDLIQVEIEPDALLLFCTDGLTGLVSEDEILAAASKQPDPKLLAETLIDLANARGGHDNITVVIATGIGGQKD